jgi:hypothetical protein
MVVCTGVDMRISLVSSCRSHIGKLFVFVFSTVVEVEPAHDDVSSPHYSMTLGAFGQ